MSIKVREEVLKVPHYIAGKPINDVKRELGIDDIIKLASNENPYGCSENVKSAIRSMLDDIYLYPDAGNHDLLDLLSNELGIGRSEIFIGGGSSSLIKVICNTLLSVEDESIMPSLTFPLYESYTNLMGAKPIKVDLKNFKLDIEKMIEKITDRTKIIWFCNPNNPTGTIFTHDEIESVIEKIPEHIVVVIDEAYLEYVSSELYPNSLELFKKYKNVLILRTLSKAYGLASLRVGYGVANSELVSFMNRVINPFEVNLFAQVAAISALKDKNHLKKVVEFNNKEREFFYENFKRLGYEYIKSETNFIMFKVLDDKKLSEYLLKHGVIVRAGYLLGCEGFIRVSIGTREQNKKFFELLKMFK